jgi:hypothetical protein
MSVSILVVDDELDVADLFRQHFRREVRQGTYDRRRRPLSPMRPFLRILNLLYLTSAGIL